MTEDQQNDNEKYRNSDKVQEILEGDDNSECKIIKDLNGWSDDDLKLYRYFAKMRKAEKEPMKVAVERRKSEDSLATDDEMQVGCYLDGIESQVRDAVIKFNKKGFSTNYSGFDGFKTQTIRFKAKKNTIIDLHDVEKKWSEKGVKIEIENEEINLIFSKEVPLEEIKEIWNEIAEAMPDLGGFASAEKKPHSKDFYEVQDLLRAGKISNYYERHIEIKKRYKELADLRLAVHEKMDEETIERIKNNPIPTEEEIMAGAFKEEIEPQVRGALFEFYKKGYSTESSGFGGEYGQKQAIDGYFVIDEETKRKIESLGVEVLKGKDCGMPGLGDNYTFIMFSPEEANLDKIKEKWNAIADILPQLETPALPSASGASDDFRKQYCPDRWDIEKKTTIKVLSQDVSPDLREKLERRLEEKLVQAEKAGGVRGYLKEYFDLKQGEVERLDLFDAENFHNEYKKQLEFFNDERLKDVIIVVMPDELWPGNKISESHAEKKLVVMRKSYFEAQENTDEIAWMTHELAHCQNYLDLGSKKLYENNQQAPAFTDIGVDYLYPNNLVELHAFTQQFRYLKNKGKSKEKILEMLKETYGEEDMPFFKKILDNI